LEATVSMEIASHTLISGGTILAIGTLTALLAQKIKIPDIPVFLFVGMAIGPQVLRIN
jgi:potassium/hydrogen antiporter